ncbi:MAG: TspO/MBR family protein [Candidatus Nanoarchaeia archaeon]|jgi:tryptophan-rich sensory protein
MKRKFEWKKLIISIIIAQAAGMIGSVFTTPSIATWYASINRPPITPPNWLFAPMWISLFTLMGVGFYFIWVKGIKKHKLASTLYFIQLGLNSLWSIIFFGLHSILFGAIEIVFLWFFILATIIEFKAVDKRAGYLLLPYLAWVTLATLLNISIVFFNP